MHGLTSGLQETSRHVRTSRVFNRRRGFERERERVCFFKVGLHTQYIPGHDGRTSSKGCRDERRNQVERFNGF
jgi:hypothetical protein